MDSPTLLNWSKLDQIAIDKKEEPKKYKQNETEEIRYKKNKINRNKIQKMNKNKPGQHEKI